MGRDRSFYATLLVLGLSQGASYPLIRFAVRELSPAALMELRVAFAAPVLVAYCVLTGRAAQLRRRAPVSPSASRGSPSRTS